MEKKSGKRREYLDKYVPDGTGKFVYTGVYYTLTGGKDAFHRARLWYLLLSIAEAACLLGMGCLPTGSSRSAFVMLPYVLAFLPAILTVLASLTIAASGGKLTEHRFKTSVSRLRGSAVFGMVFGAAAAVGQLVYLFTAQNAKTRWADGVFLAGTLAIVLLSYLLMKTNLRCTWDSNS